MAGQVVSTTLKLVLYDELTAAWTDWQGGGELRSMPTVVCGVVSGLATTLVTQPIDVLRIHLQRQLGWRAAAAQAVEATRERRLLALLYRGWSKGLLKTGVASALFFPLTTLGEHTLARAFPIVGPQHGAGPQGAAESQGAAGPQGAAGLQGAAGPQGASSGVGLWHTGVAALFAAVVGATAMQPLDYAKTRAQAAKHVQWREWRAMWTGYDLNMARILPHFVIVMVIKAALTAAPAVSPTTKA